MSQYID